MRRSVLLFGLILAIAITGTGVVSAQATITIVTLNNLRMRSGPGTQFDVVTVVPAGTSLTADARSARSDWVRVNFNGQVGWLFVGQLRIVGNLAGLPTADKADSPTAPSTPPNGAIEVLDRYVSTAGADYYHLVYWSDGLRISGFYAEPKGDGKFPAVVYNRSGNRATGALTGQELAPFAESGFVVVASQLRGFNGDGQDEFGGADVHDVISLVPLLKSRPKVDPNRLAIFGSSRGGMMTYLALKWQSQNRTRDFKVAATVGGIADLIMWANQRPDLNTGFYPELIGVSTKQDLRPFVDRSATYWPYLIRVPILLQHGEADDQVSVAQSRKLYNLLRASGRVVRLKIYPGGDHPLSAFEAGLPEVMKWFQRYVARPGDNFDWNVHREAIYNAIAALRR
jgi:fermentation-respiration switch protein FrsA (DUF1100 family)